MIGRLKAQWAVIRAKRFFFESHSLSSECEEQRERGREKRSKTLMVKLTADLIWNSPHFFNAVKERELELRGNKIPVIENLGATEDQFDTIDLSDNEIVKLENFPLLNRLEFLPKLHTLVLTNNRLVNLVEIDPLASIPKLQYLSLLDNNITKKPNYRLYVIHKLKSLRERAEAAALFSSKEVEEEVKKVSREEVQKVSDSTEEPDTPKVVAPTQEQILAIKAAIINSQTIEEIARLEQALKFGQVPAGLIVPDLVHSNVATKDGKPSSGDPMEVEFLS
ncbi:hypothetical protein YC2023_069669 [Brassica napus]